MLAVIFFGRIDGEKMFKRKKKIGTQVPPQYDPPPMPPVRPPKREPMKEFDGMYDSIVGKHYTIQVVTASSNVCEDMMSPHFLKNRLYKTYKNVKLVNINGMGIHRSGGR